MIFFTAMAAVMLTAWPELWPSPWPGAPSTSGTCQATPGFCEALGMPSMSRPSEHGKQEQCGGPEFVAHGARFYFKGAGVARRAPSPPPHQPRGGGQERLFPGRVARSLALPVLLRRLEDPPARPDVFEGMARHHEGEVDQQSVAVRAYESAALDDLPGEDSIHGLAQRLVAAPELETLTVAGLPRLQLVPGVWGKEKVAVLGVEVRRTRAVVVHASDTDYEESDALTVQRGHEGDEG